MLTIVVGSEEIIIKTAPNTGIKVKYEGWNVLLLKKKNERMISVKPKRDKIFSYLFLKVLFFVSCNAKNEPAKNSHILEIVEKKLNDGLFIEVNIEIEKLKINKIKKNWKKPFFKNLNKNISNKGKKI